MITEIVRRSPPAYDAARRLFWSRPGLYVLFSGLRNHRLINDINYDLCLEGFPRSANTYLKMVLEDLSPTPLRIQSHFHCPPAVLLALDAGKPVCLTVRHPEQAIVSRSIYNANSVEDGLYRYLSFHELLLPVLDHPLLAVASFDAITTRLPAVLAHLNTSLSLRLPVDGAPEEIRARAYSRIEAQSLERYGRIEETIVHRPSAHRRSLAPAWQRQLDDPRLGPLRRKAVALYETFASRSC